MAGGWKSATAPDRKIRPRDEPPNWKYPSLSRRIRLGFDPEGILHLRIPRDGVRCRLTSSRSGPDMYDDVIIIGRVDRTSAVWKVDTTGCVNSVAAGVVRRGRETRGERTARGWRRSRSPNRTGWTTIPSTAAIATMMMATRMSRSMKYGYPAGDDENLGAHPGCGQPRTRGWVEGIDLAGPDEVECGVRKLRAGLWPDSGRWSYA
jgi:hypothetical protein